MTGNDDQNNGRRNPWGRPQENQGPWGQNRRPPEQPEGPDFEDFVRRMTQGVKNPFGNGSQGLVLLILGAVALWLASGLYLIGPAENAVIKRFGNYERTQAQPGLGYHLPYPIETVTKLNVMQDRRIQIGYGDSGYANAKRSDLPEESLMLTADANIVDIDVIVLWNIAEAEKFIFNIRNPEQTIKRVAESAIRETVGQTRLQNIIAQGRDDVAVRIQKSLQAILDSYNSGVAIKQVLIQEATVHPEVLEAYNDVAASRQDAERFQNEAMIYRNDIIPKARGEAIKMTQDAEAYKQEEIARATGDATRFQAILDAYRSGKDVTRDRFYIETMEKIFSNAERLIIDQDVSKQGAMPILPLDMMRSKQQPNPNGIQ